MQRQVDLPQPALYAGPRFPDFLFVPLSARGKLEEVYTAHSTTIFYFALVWFCIICDFWLNVWLNSKVTMLMWRLVLPGKAATRSISHTWTWFPKSLPVKKFDTLSSIFMSPFQLGCYSLRTWMPQQKQLPLSRSFCLWSSHTCLDSSVIANPANRSWKVLDLTSVCFLKQMRMTQWSLPFGWPVPEKGSWGRALGETHLCL